MLTTTRIGVVLLTILFNGLTCTDSIQPNPCMPSLTHEDDIFDDILPNTILPRNYNITLKPNDDIFYGTVSIHIEVIEPTSVISFHLQNLKIDYESITLERIDDQHIYKINGQHRCVKTHITSLSFDTELPHGSYILYMQYTGNMEENLGFVKIKHIKWENTISYITVLEPNGARRVFPCWDEPKFKTTFDISVEHWPGYYVFSNIKEHTSVKLEDRIRTSFKITYLMPTYLVTIGILHSMYGDMTDDTVWFSNQVPLESIKRLQEIVKWTDKYLMNYMDNFWSNLLTTNAIAFPELPNKIIGSWQCAVFRDSDITQKPTPDYFSGSRNIWGTVTYGLIRNYIENVVTPSKWSHLWFSKAFEYKISYNILKEHYNTEWITQLYVVQVLLPAMHNDIAFNVPPIKHKYDRIYSSLIYKKAFAILNMLEQIVKEDVFLKASIEYIKMHFATPNDFFEAVNIIMFRSTGKFLDNTTNLMTSWLSYKEYPTLLVKRYYNNRTINLSYDDTGNNSIKHKDWVIPITYIAQRHNYNHEKPMLWSGNISSPYNNSITFPVIDNNDWIILNEKEYGYYRVNYDHDNWLKIANYLNNNDYWKIYTVTRARIIDDAYHFVIEERINTIIYYSLIKYLKRETHYIVWHAVMNTLTYMSPFFKFRESNNFTELMSSSINSALMTIEENEDDKKLHQTLRLLLLNWACKHGDQKCRKRANIELTAQLDSTKKYEKGWMDWLLCAGLMNTRNDTWEKIKQHIAHGNDVENIEYLACNENDDMIVELLKSIIFDPGNNWSQVTSIQLKILYNAIVKKHASKEKVLNFLLENFDSIFPSYMTNTEKISNIILSQYSKCHMQKISNYMINNFKWNEDRDKINYILRRHMDWINKQRYIFVRHFTQNAVIEKCWFNRI
ncbi:glutamyl aminopeptidase-like [Odontomachus brunneus]|uniref:glutamyl aminopeptidase-like n=1 Tax=Odontomachus brunneus TaxID=486640 RepID=UPI0013F1CD87|nr:glutamyl aminopeptidase-like [Odontomachus brunneus]